MAGPRALFRRARERPLFAVAVAVAGLQIALGARISRGDYGLMVAIAWLAALFVSWEGRGTERAAPPGPVARIVGAVAILGALVPMGVMGEYGGVARVFPLLAGMGLCVVDAGLPGWMRHRKALFLLALPLLDPVPKVLRRVVESPSWMTGVTWCAMVVNRIMGGHPMTAEGTALHTSNGTLDVLVGCSGLLGIARLLVLAALVVALFPTRLWQRVGLFTSAIVVGFVLNSARIAVLARSLRPGDDAPFDYWHEGGGATIFSVASVAVAGLAWWLLLRGGSEVAREATPAATTLDASRSATPAAGGRMSSQGDVARAPPRP